MQRKSSNVQSINDQKWQTNSVDLWALIPVKVKLNILYIYI